MPSEKPTLPDRIAQAGDRVDKTLESAQNAATKLLKRLLGILAGIAVAIVLGYQAIQGFEEKTKPIFDGKNVEKIDEDAKSKTFRIKSRKAGSEEPSSENAPAGLGK
jgi:hypothetical protein